MYNLFNSVFDIKLSNNVKISLIQSLAYILKYYIKHKKYLQKPYLLKIYLLNKIYFIILRPALHVLILTGNNLS